MQEDIIKHMKRAVAVMNDPNSSFWKRCREILLEVVIIIFAVSVSISFHIWNTNKQQHAEVREFLTDLKQDLLKDKNNLIEEKKILDRAMLAIADMKSLTAAKLTNVKALNLTVHLINRKTFSGNYDGFKSSGKIGYIRNKGLKNAILSYYQESMPSLDQIEQFRNKQGLEIIELVGESNLQANQLTTPRIRTKLGFVEQATSSLIEAYSGCLTQADLIIAQIDKELTNS